MRGNQEGDLTYINSYWCEDCDILWEDVWECMCNDKCPMCDIETEPFNSDIEETDDSGISLQREVS